jgi:hypothetical protein
MDKADMVADAYARAPTPTGAADTANDVAAVHHQVAAFCDEQVATKLALLASPQWTERIAMVTQARQAAVRPVRGCATVTLSCADAETAVLDHLGRTGTGEHQSAAAARHGRAAH